MSVVGDLHRLYKEKKVCPPRWLLDNVHYLALVGSISYGCPSDESDWDVQGFCIPPKEDIFPHLRGEIQGFGTQIQRFDVWQEHHIKDDSKQREYDFCIYSIVKFFQLCMENNPNMLDILSVPQRCVLQASPIGQMVRDNRKLFFHKGAYHKFRGYAFKQMSKLDQGSNRSNPKRAENIEKYGYDTKFLMHVIRLALEAEQLLTVGELTIDSNSQLYQSIRRGDWTLEDGKKWFSEKERQLEHLYATSSILPYKPNEEAIKQLLLNCLEHHYGSLSNAVTVPSQETKLLNDLKLLIQKYE